MKKIYKISKTVIGAVLLVFLLLVAFTFIPITRLFGGQAGNYKIFTVQSGSMEPAIKTGSLIFVHSKGDYKTGDIVTRKTNDPKVTVTHRIIEVSKQDGEAVYVTKGDANNAEDPQRAKKDEIVGKMIFDLPFVGYPIGYARTAPGFLILVVIPSVIIIYEELRKIKEEIGKFMFKRRSKKFQDEKVSVEEENSFARPSQEDNQKYEKLFEEKKPKRRKLDL